MSAPFVTQLRTSREPLMLAGAGGDTLTIRVEASDIWDAVRVEVSSATNVAELKERVVGALFQNDPYAERFVLKLRGWEVLDERQSVAEAGILDGSILLLAYRRRRPVR